MFAQKGNIGHTWIVWYAEQGSNHICKQLGIWWGYSGGSDMGSLSGKHGLQTQQERQEVGDLANNPWAWWLILSERLNLSLPIPLHCIWILWAISSLPRLTLPAFGDCSAAGILPTNSWISLKFQTVQYVNVPTWQQFLYALNSACCNPGMRRHLAQKVMHGRSLILRSPSVLSFHHQVSLDLEKTCDKNDATGEFLSEMINLY